MIRRLAIVLLGIFLTGAALAGLRTLARSRTTQLFGGIIARVETTDSVVALTFDDGPWHPGADSINAILARADVRATFFLIGSAVTEQPEDTRKLIAAGHELGNHSYSHKRMVLRTPAFVRTEVERTDSVLRAVGYARPLHFRPPYGVKLLALPWYLDRTGRTTITWDVEPDSYGYIREDPARIVEFVSEHTRPGSIIILHPWGATNGTIRQSIPGIVRTLRAQGYEFVTVSELLTRRAR